MKNKILSILVVLVSFATSHDAFAQTAQQLELLQQNPELLEQFKNQQQKTTTPTTTEVFDQSRSSELLDTTQLKEFEQYVEEHNKELEEEQIVTPIYGHSLFTNENLSFTPSLNIPTPENYVLSSGDQLFINVWGEAQSEYDVKVTPDGYINLSNIGLVSVRGLTIRSVEQRIISLLHNTMEGIDHGAVKVNVSLGDIRSITVNVTGEAKIPGTYTLPSLATLFNALYVAGGVSEIGSVRNIKLYRAGKLISSLDVYDYLLKGKLDLDKRLEDNDLIVVEPYANVVNITGQVKRPMRYELKSGETLANLVIFCGGFSGNALSTNLNVNRSASGKQMEIFTVAKAGFEYFPMMDCDSVSVNKVSELYANRVTISGAVWEPGYYELNQSKISSVKTLVLAAQGVKDDAFLGRVQLIRKNKDNTLSAESLNLGNILNGLDADVALMPNDSLSVLSKEELMPKQYITVVGEVNTPDTLDYYHGQSLQGAIMMAGGFTDAASMARIEVARRVSSPDATAPSVEIAELFSFKLSNNLSLDAKSLNFSLMPFDVVTVRRSPGYYIQQPVFVEGEAVFVGQYTLKNNKTTLSDLLKEAGGITSEANIKGAYLRRRKTEDDVQRDKTIAKMMDSPTLVGRDTLEIEQIEVGQYYSVGIDLQAAVKNPKGISDLVLQEGDKLVIPTFVNTVKISGAVYYPNTVTYDPSLSIKDYVAQAGGYTKRSIRKPFVIYQNGMISLKSKNVEPGCEIVVPQKPERDPMSAGEWVSLGSSVTSMAAVILSLLK